MSVVISVLERMRQKTVMSLIETSLDYIVNSRPAELSKTLSQKTKKKKTKINRKKKFKTYKHKPKYFEKCINCATIQFYIS